MKVVWLKRTTIGLIALVLLATCGVYATGNATKVSRIIEALLNKPDFPFDPADATAAPDYAVLSSWAALPGKTNLADLTPAGTKNRFNQGDAPADVFFIHPTGFHKGSSWTFSMDENTGTEEKTQWMMANQASVYNGCCNVYAPRYRQASIFAFFGDEKIKNEVLDVAYQDVVQAFEYYIKHYNQGRPFIISGHSQGTYHGIRLLKEVIDKTPLAKQMVAAYIIGGQITSSHFETMQDIKICTQATDLNCAIHWDTFSDAIIGDSFPERADNICINPLSWQLDGPLAGKEQHLGAVYPSGEFHAHYSGSDAATGIEFPPLEAPKSNYLQAQCKNGMLFITDQSGTPFEKFRHSFMKGSYHLLDYSFFHMDIRENAKLRIETYLKQRANQIRINFMQHKKAYL